MMPECDHRTIVDENMVKCAHWRVRAPGDLIPGKFCSIACTWRGEPNKPKPDYPFPPPMPCGPGCRLTKLIKYIGIEAGGCQCEYHAGEMDTWGPEMCRKHIDYTVGVMESNATKLGVPFNQSIARWIVGLAITLSEDDREPNIREHAKLLAIKAGAALIA